MVAADVWSRPIGRRGPALHAVPSNTHTDGRLFPAASKPPITYSFPPAAVAADSSSAAGRDASMRCVGGGGVGDGEGDWITGEGLGDDGEGNGLAACSGPAQDATRNARRIAPFTTPQ